MVPKILGAYGTPHTGHVACELCPCESCGDVPQLPRSHAPGAARSPNVFLFLRMCGSLVSSSGLTHNITRQPPPRCSVHIGARTPHTRVAIRHLPTAGARRNLFDIVVTVTSGPPKSRPRQNGARGRDDGALASAATNAKTRCAAETMVRGPQRLNRSCRALRTRLQSSGIAARGGRWPSSRPSIAAASPGPSRASRPPCRRSDCSAV